MSLKLYENSKNSGIPPFDDTVVRRLTAKGGYIPSEELKRAVDLALFLGQPLLLTGEPGTGKTELARHLAEYFSENGEAENFYVFNTKTTSTATDLFYRYDSIRHFHYIQTQKEGEPLTLEEIEERFIKYQALGKAIRSGKRAVVLIDEIDKAPRDLPNDILDVLLNLKFEVPEVEKVGDNAISTTSENRPIIVMTSNSEKNLPDPFLRRCIFYHIPFPENELLLRILKGKCDRFNEEQLKLVIAHFRKIRNKCRRKLPSTAELLQWVAVLERLDEEKRLSPKDIEGAKDQKKTELQMSYSVLVKEKEDRDLVIGD